ncbi:MAG: prolyl hydroxylase family protein [Sphingomonadales bacterium]
MSVFTPPDSRAITQRLMASDQVGRVPAKTLELFFCRKFLDDRECNDLITLIDQGRRPSTQADEGDDPYYRTSETTDLDAKHPVVAALDKKIAALTGLDLILGEPVQGQRYDLGQEFKEHTDYFEPSGRDYNKYCSVAGQRTWTVMVYLNEPKAGGATRFKRIKKIVRPERGKLLAWNNMDLTGQPNPATLHHGMKVRAGVKYIITKWFREKPWGWA